MVIGGCEWLYRTLHARDQQTDHLRGFGHQFSGMSPVKQEDDQLSEIVPRGTEQVIRTVPIGSAKRRRTTSKAASASITEALARS